MPQRLSLTLCVLAIVSFAGCESGTNTFLPAMASESEVLPQIESRLRNAFIKALDVPDNPVGRQAAEYLRKHKKIVFKIAPGENPTSFMWHSWRQNTIYIDLRFVKEHWTLNDLATDSHALWSFIDEMAGNVVHELVHAELAFEWPYRNLDADKLGRPPLDDAWNSRYQNAGEYLCYLKEQTFSAYKMMQDPEYISKRVVPARKWRWEYYQDDLEKYCEKVLENPCRQARLDDVQQSVYPEIDRFYRKKIAEAERLREGVLAELVKNE